MGSSGQPDRSLGSGISLPQWMKGKVDTRFDFDESSFSPPSYEDNFFYIRYNKKPQNPQTTEQGFTPIGDVLGETKKTGITATNQVTSGRQTVSDFKEVKEIDFSKHPLPCQPFIPATTAGASETKFHKATFAGKSKVKSQGTDDGFHGEPALCGKSIVHVANQMMSTQITKTSTTTTTSKISSDFRNKEMESFSSKGSKSLPVTPQTSPMGTPDSSPKSRRKHSNRYFTGQFVPDREKYQGGWILSSLLGQSREITSTKIEEEDEGNVEAPPPRALSRKKSISTQNLTYITNEDTKSSTKSTTKSTVYTSVFEAKPSELREMNFWSPTSM